MAEIVYFVFLVLFKDGGHRVSPSFHLFSIFFPFFFLFIFPFSDVNKGEEGSGRVQDFLA